MSMWEPFTERARRCVVLAQEESQRLGNNYLGTEHMLMGIVSEGESLAAKALNLSLTQVRAEVEAIVGRGGSVIQKEMVWTPRGKRMIELAFDEARKFNHNYIGTEHLILGLIREGEGVGMRVLVNLRVDVEKYVADLGKLIKADTRPAKRRELATVRVQGTISAKLLTESDVTDAIVNLCDARGWQFSGGVVKADEDQ